MACKECCPASQADVNLLSQGRLTVVSGDPVPPVDQVAKDTLYFTPYKGNRVALWDGSWDVLRFSELSVDLAGLEAGKNFDVFAFADDCSVALELSDPWTSNTVRAEAIGLQHGVVVLESDHSRRYLGTIRTSATGVTEDSQTKRFVANFNNRVDRTLFTCPGYLDDGVGTTYPAATPAWSEANGGVGSKVEFVSVGSFPVACDLACLGSTASSFSGAGIGVDSPSDAKMFAYLQAPGVPLAAAAFVKEVLADGYHYFDLLTVSGMGTSNFFADLPRVGSSKDPFATYLSGSVSA